MLSFDKDNNRMALFPLLIVMALTVFIGQDALVCDTCGCDIHGNSIGQQGIEDQFLEVLKIQNKHNDAMIK